MVGVGLAVSASVAWLGAMWAYVSNVQHEQREKDFGCYISLAATPNRI
jgi:hypothetical protein